MMKKTINKKGLVPIVVAVIIALALLIIYLFLFLPIPKFSQVRITINYFLIVIFWIVLQVGIIYGYYSLGRLAIFGFNKAKGIFVNWDTRIRKYILFHS